MAESEAECFSGVKTAQNNKTELELKQTKTTTKCESEGRSHIENISHGEKPEECTVKQLQRWLLCRGAKTIGKKINAAEYVLPLILY